MKLPSSRTILICALILVLTTLFEAWVFTSQQTGIKIIKVNIFMFEEICIGLSVRYIWRRLNTVIKTNSIIAFGFMFKIVMLVALLTSMFAFPFSVLPVTSDPFVFAVIGTFGLGAVIFLTTCLGISDIISFSLRQLLKLSGHSRAGASLMDRTEIKIRSLLALICASALFLYGVLGAAGIAIQHVSVPIRGLDFRLNGTTIVQLSDIHLGPYIGKRAMEGIVQKVNTLNADIVVITGDLVDSSFEALKDAVSSLKNIRSRKGVFYSTGNHEYYTGDVDTWINRIPQFNVTPLMNKRVCLYGQEESCDGGLYVAGLEDISTRKTRYGGHSMNIHAALSGREKGVPTIVLAHQPWAAVEAIMWDDVRLVLSGHTHAGQLFPFLPLVYLANPFFVGLYEARPSVFVYVNSGTVYFMLPFRHYYKSEITEFTLISN